jgi:mono/diheme cytochrome c family protein
MRTLGLLMFVCIGAASSAVIAAQTARQSIYSGSDDFQTYCASCHGTAAKGDGPIAKSLPKRPPDLTQLAKRNNDVFPEAQVFKTIDGRTPGASHPGADMPMWGDVFAKAGESAGPEAAAARITALVTYLERIQAKR